MFVSNFHNNNEPVETFSNKLPLTQAFGKLKLLVNQFNNASSEDNADNIVQCKCCNIDELQS